jgi:hypothetical protein
MKTLEVRARQYRMKTFDHFSLKDIKRFVELYEQAAAGPENMLSPLRTTIPIVAPLAARDIETWSDGEVLQAVGQTTAHFNEILRDGGTIHFVEESDLPAAVAPNLIVESYNVGPDFFELYGIPILRGRVFQQDDPPEAAIVGERLGALFWPGGDPIGRSFTFDNERYDVIGVARETHLPTLEQRLDRPEFYRPLLTGPSQFMMSIRCDSTCPDVALVRKRIVDAGNGAGVVTVAPLESEYLAQTSRPRAAAALAFSFAAISLIAATLGLFSVLNYAVSHRRREFGIRFALGAQPAEVRRLVFLEGLFMAGGGLTLGCFVAWWVSRSLTALTYGISPGDPSTWVLVTAIVGLTVLAASWRPAARASRVDPATLLREE